MLGTNIISSSASEIVLVSGLFDRLVGLFDGGTSVSHNLFCFAAAFLGTWFVTSARVAFVLFDVLVRVLF